MRLRISLLLLACFLAGAGLLHVVTTGSPEGGALAPAAAGTATEPAPDAPVAVEPVAEDDAAHRSAPSPAEAQPKPEPASLPQRLASLVADESLQARSFGVSVTAADGTSVFGHSDGAGLLPASSQKLLVAAGALAALGPDFRYETEARATSPPAADGLLEGDIVLVGSGDPALGTPQYGGLVPERPRTPLEDLADRIVASGVSRVTGSVLGDARVFPDQPLAPGWPYRYIDEDDTSRSSGLTAEGGRRLFVESGRMRSEPSADPAATAAASLHGLLVDRGVMIDGGAGAARPPSAPVHLGTVTSPRLLDLLRYAVQRSDNHLADAIFRTLGAVAGDATWAGSAVATMRALAPLGLDLSGVTLADGSGLSRSNRLSPEVLTQLDVAMTTSQLGSQWQGLMAVAGESGTLRRRLIGSVADRRLRGKTGSLEDVTTLSGAVIGPGGSRYHFAVLGDNLDRTGKAAVRRLQDLVVLVLAEDLYDCEWVRPPGGAPREPELVCAA